MKRTGLYFGSFNPVHVGHLMVAQSFYNTGFFEKIIFVVSPHNPFKDTGELLPENKRLEWVKKSIKGNPAFEVSDIEFSLPKPGYTIDTVKAFLKQGLKNPALLMGGDNLINILKWKNIDELVKLVDIYVYNRNEKQEIKIPFDIHYYNAPYISISATTIREMAAKCESIKYLVSDEIQEEVQREIIASLDNG